MFRELLARPGVVELCELRARIGLMAFHGGNLERVTDVVAVEVARRTETSLYAVLQKPPLRIHLTSTGIDPIHSQKLSRFLGHVQTAIAIHGYGHRPGIRHHVLVGGRNRRLARHIASHLREGLSECYPVLDDLLQIPVDLRGLHLRNPVNRPRGRGVQIELPPAIRWNRRENGWSDHQGVSRAADVDRLIDVLTRAVDSWQAQAPPHSSEGASLKAGSSAAASSVSASDSTSPGATTR